MVRAKEAARLSGHEAGASGFARPLAMAFQPIVDTARQTVFAFEALVRGPAGEDAGSVLAGVAGHEVQDFDQACRVRAIETAAALGAGSEGAALSINFLPSAVADPRRCIRTTLQTAARVNFPTNRLIFEITQGETLLDPDHLARIVGAHRAMGLRTAIDHAGGGRSNLDWLARFRPDIVKLDMAVLRGIQADRAQQDLLRHSVARCAELDVTLIAEGIETAAEYATVTRLGVRLVQGFYVAPPAFMALSEPDWSCAMARAA